MSELNLKENQNILSDKIIEEIQIHIKEDYWKNC